MAVVLDIDFEGGDLTEFTGTVIDGGDFSAAAPAALAGTGFGAQAVIDDTTAIYGYNTINITSGVVRARFYFDINSLTMANENSHALLIFTDISSNEICSVFLAYYTAVGYRTRARMVDDAAAIHYTTPDYDLTDEPHYIEILFTRASSAVASDGELTVWVDGNLYTTVTGVDNFDRMDAVELVIFGPSSGIDPGVSGTMYFDQLVVNDDGQEIGAYGAAPAVSGSRRAGMLLPR